MNDYFICQQCGNIFTVDLFGDNDGDVYSAEIPCKKCGGVSVLRGSQNDQTEYFTVLQNSNGTEFYVVSCRDETVVLSTHSMLIDAINEKNRRNGI